jgi:hypothetical protein
MAGGRELTVVERWERKDYQIVQSSLGRRSSIEWVLGISCQVGGFSNSLNGDKENWWGEAKPITA